MTTITKATPRAETTKTAARSIQRRFFELGTPIPLSHAYEAIAAASGHRNWQTMKATAAPSDQGYVLGRRISRPSVVEAGQEVRLPYHRCLDHFEFLGERRSVKTIGMLGLTENAIRSGVGLLFVTTSPTNNVSAEIKRMAALHGRSDDVNVVSVSSSSFGRYRPLFEVEAWAALLDSSAHRWSPGQIALGEALLPAAAAALRMRSGLREHVSPALLGDHLSLESLIDLGDPVCHREMPVYARSGVRRYLKSIQGFREDFHYRQSPSVRALHLSVAEPMRDILERWCEFSDKPEVEVSLDRVVQGSEIAVIVLPPPSDDLYMMEACASEVVADFARACSAAASSRQRDPGLAVFDHFDRYWSDDLPAMLKAASQAGMGVVIEAENSLNISAMKKATTFVDDSSWGTRRVVTAEWEALVDE